MNKEIYPLVSLSSHRHCWPNIKWLIIGEALKKSWLHHDNMSITIILVITQYLSLFLNIFIQKKFASWQMSLDTDDKKIL